MAAAGNAIANIAGHVVEDVVDEVIGGVDEPTLVLAVVDEVVNSVVGGSGVTASSSAAKSTGAETTVTAARAARGRANDIG